MACWPLPPSNLNISTLGNVRAKSRLMILSYLDFSASSLDSCSYNDSKLVAEDCDMVCHTKPLNGCGTPARILADKRWGNFPATFGKSSMRQPQKSQSIERSSFCSSVSKFILRGLLGYAAAATSPLSPVKGWLGISGSVTRLCKVSKWAFSWLDSMQTDFGSLSNKLFWRSSRARRNSVDSYKHSR